MSSPALPWSSPPVRHPTLDRHAWPDVHAHLGACGWAMLTGLLDAGECAALAALYADDPRFRSRIVMARHGFGRGEYK